MGTSDEFGHFPGVDSNVAPSDLEKYSIAPSASAQVIADRPTCVVSLSKERHKDNLVVTS